MSRRERVRKTALAKAAMEAAKDPRMMRHGTVLKPLTFDPYVDTFRLAPVDPDRVREEPEWYHKDYNLGEAGE